MYHSDLITGMKMYRESTIVSGVTKCIGSVLENFQGKNSKKNKMTETQKETEMEKFIFHGKIILSTNQKSVTKVYHSDLVTGTKMYRESTIVSGVSKCIGSVLRKFS
jgi:hypothetical protein